MTKNESNARYARLHRAVLIGIDVPQERESQLRALLSDEFVFTRDAAQETDLVVCDEQSGVRRDDVPALFWGARRSRTDAYCFLPDARGAKQKLDAYVDAAVMTQKKRHDFARQAPFVCVVGADDDAALERFMRTIGDDARLCGVGLMDRQSVLDGFCCRAVILMADEAALEQAACAAFLQEAQKRDIPVCAVLEHGVTDQMLAAVYPQARVLGDALDVWSTAQNTARAVGASENGAKSLYDGACMRLYGVGRERDLREGMRLLELAAQNQNVCAMLLLSDCCRWSIARAHDAALQNDWLEKAAHRALETAESLEDLRECQEACSMLVRRFAAAGKRARAQVLARAGVEACEAFLERDDSQKARSLYAQSLLRAADFADECGDLGMQSEMFARYAQTEFDLCGGAGSDAQAQMILARLDELTRRALEQGEDRAQAALAQAAVRWQRAVFECGGDVFSRGALASYLDLLGEIHIRAGEYTRACAAFEECAALYENWPDAQDETHTRALATCCARLGAALEGCGAHERACEAFSRAAKLWAALFDASADAQAASGLCEALLQRASSAQKSGWPDAQGLAIEAQETCERFAREIRSALIWESLARVYELQANLQDDPRERMAYLTRAAQLWQELFDLTYEERFRALGRDAQREIKKINQSLAPPNAWSRFCGAAKKTAAEASAKARGSIALAREKAARRLRVQKKDEEAPHGPSDEPRP